VVILGSVANKTTQQPYEDQWWSHQSCKIIITNGNSKCESYICHQEWQSSGIIPGKVRWYLKCSSTSWRSTRRGTVKSLPIHGKTSAWSVLKCGWPKTGCSSMTISQHISHLCSSSSQTMVLWCFPTYCTLLIKHYVIFTSFHRRRITWRVFSSSGFGECIAAGHVWWLPDMFWTIIWTLAEVCSWWTVFWRWMCLRISQHHQIRDKAPVPKLFEATM
jgi:hypothetical protein